MIYLKLKRTSRYKMYHVMNLLTTFNICNNGAIKCRVAKMASRAGHARRKKRWQVYCNVLIIKPTRCTNFSNLFLEYNSTCLGQFLCPSSGVFHCTHSYGICHTGLLCAQWKTPYGGQRNCPRHVELYSKNKFEKLVHLVGFIIRIYHDARSSELQTMVVIMYA